MPERTRRLDPCCEAGRQVGAVDASTDRWTLRCLTIDSDLPQIHMGLTQVGIRMAEATIALLP